MNHRSNRKTLRDLSLADLERKRLNELNRMTPSEIANVERRYAELGLGLEL